MGHRAPPQPSNGSRRSWAGRRTGQQPAGEAIVGEPLVETPLGSIVVRARTLEPQGAALQVTLHCGEPKAGVGSLGELLPLFPLSFSQLTFVFVVGTMLLLLLLKDF